MSWRRNARAVLALVAAYAVALQATLLGFGGALQAGSAASPICAGSIAGGDQPAPSAPCCDCLAACLIGCGVASAISPPQTAVVYAPQPLQRLAATGVLRSTALPYANGAHRSRAPPAG